MSRTFADGTSSVLAFATYDFERVLWIYLAPFGDELSTSGTWAEDPGFPRCTELQDALHECALLFSIQNQLED